MSKKLEERVAVLERELEVVRRQAACIHTWETDAQNLKKWTCSNCHAVHPKYHG